MLFQYAFTELCTAYEQLFHPNTSMTELSPKKIFELLKSQSLSFQEKNDMKYSILEKIAGTIPVKSINTVRNRENYRHQYRREHPIFAYWNNYFQNKKRIFMFTTLLVLPILGTASAFARQSLPGDTLYLIKIHMNEPMRKLLAVDKESQALYEATLSLERVKELEILAQENKLNEDNAAQVSEQFIEHVSNVNLFTKELVAEGKTLKANEIQKSLRNELSKKEKSIELLSKLTKDTSKEELKNFISLLRKAISSHI